MITRMMMVIVHMNACACREECIAILVFLIYCTKSIIVSNKKYDDDAKLHDDSSKLYTLTYYILFG